MPKFYPRTLKQNNALHKLLDQRGFAQEDKADMVFDFTKGRTEHSSEMSFDECNAMITHLGGQAFPKSGTTPRRTTNYRRQQAGIEQIASPTHKDLMRNLWRKKDDRTDEGLESLSARVNKGLRIPRTTKEVNRVIEAIKAMNRRDRTFDLGKKSDQEAA